MMNRGVCLFACSLAFATNCAVTQLHAQPLPEPVANPDDLRIPRMVRSSNHFQGLSAGYARRWIRNLANPSFCRMNLCHGSCADATRSPYDPSIIGTPSLYSLADRSSFISPAPGDLTPCSLRTFRQLIGASPPTCSHHEVATFANTIGDAASDLP
jgi:hypothetical protein